jgi:DNA repair exonuclease SbcCD ATPase subunit
MKITNLSMSGFRYVTDKETNTYNFSDFTSILGDNETGKTTIQEAIVWGLLGCNLNGNDKANALLQNKKSKNMYVEVKFVDNNGNPHTVERSTGAKTTIALDGKVVKQEEIYTYTADKDTFLSVFVPGYFESRDTTKTRKFLMDTMPPIGKDEVIAKLPESYQGRVPQRGTLDPAGFIKEKRKEIKDNEATIIAQRGKMAVIDENLKQTVPVAKTFDDTEIKELENKKQSLLSTRPAFADISALKSDLQKLDYEKPELKDTTTLRTKLVTLESDYKREKSNLKELNIKAGDVCGSCGQIIANEFVANVAISIDEHNRSVTAKMDKAVTDGKIVKQQILNTENENAETEATFNKGIQAKKLSLINQISKIEIDNKKLDEDFTAGIKDEVDRINSKLTVLRAEQQTVAEHNANVKTIQDNLQKAKDQKVSVQAEIDNLENDNQLSIDNINVLTEYSKIKTEILANNIAKYLDKVTIKLEKFVASTGEIKECFEILYDNKDDITCEGVLLSTSTKIRKDLEIANMVNVITGLNLPIFIDCAESITHYKKPQCDQIFEAKVVEGQELIIK